jgi:agmatinase
MIRLLEIVRCAVAATPPDEPRFLNARRASPADVQPGEVAILGAPFGVSYGGASAPSPASAAPAAIRAQSLRLARYLDHYDFDIGAPLLAGRSVAIVDCGDAPAQMGEPADHQRATRDAVRAILAAGALPVVLGGDDSIPIPVLRAYEGHGPLCVVQIDAHIDWRDEIGGVREGLSSPMRRASEMPWVRGMAQIGMRGVGSARQAEVDAARGYGSVIIPAREVRAAGVAAALTRIPTAERYFITLDMDGLDPAIAPAVQSAAFGGLMYEEVCDLLRGVAAKGRVAGFDLVEIAPDLDVGGRTALLAARLIVVLLSALAHEGQIGT